MKKQPSLFCRSLSAKQRYEWGRYYETGTWLLNKDKETAFVYYRASADLGYIPAYHRLGDYYSERSDKVRAKKYYEAAFKLDSIHAIIKLGRLYEKLNEIDKAIEAYAKAAYKGESSAIQKLLEYSKKDNPLASVYLGMVYENEKKWDEALPQYHRAAKQNYIQALDQLGYFYQEDHPPNTNSKAIAKSIRLACEWLKKSAMLHSKRAFDSLTTLSTKYGEAAFTLGSIYDGDKNQVNSIYKDPAVATKYYKMASQLGYLEADFRLGELAELNLLLNTDIALGHFIKAAEGGHANAKEAMDRLAMSPQQKFREAALSFEIGQCYKKLKDIHKSIFHYKSAADKGDRPAKQALKHLAQMDAGNAFIIGRMYEKDDIDQAIEYYRIGMTKNDSNCIEHVKKLASREPEAMLCIARDYFMPNKKEHEAVEMLMLAVALKHEASIAYFKNLTLSRTICEKIAVTYEKGSGIHQKNIELAVIFRIKGLDSGNIEKLIHLAGLCEFKCSGLPNGKQMACEYYKKAAQLGSIDAARSLERLGKNDSVSEQTVRYTVGQTYLIDKRTKPHSTQTTSHTKSTMKNPTLTLKNRQLVSGL